MARPNKSNNKKTKTNPKPPPPVSTSKGIPTDHHTHTDTPQPTKTKSPAMTQTLFALVDKVYPVTITTNPFNHVTLATPAKNPQAKTTPNPTLDTDEPIVDMITHDVLPKPTHLATDHNTTQTSRTIPNNDIALTVKYDSLRQPVPIKYYHGPKPIPTLKAALEWNSNDYTTFIITYTREMADGNRNIFCNITYPPNLPHSPTRQTHVWKWVSNQLSAILRMHTMPSPKPQSGALKTNSITTV